jgi:endonuclease/exonuclease/phosphatase family metal-dependent hydrolase
MERKKPMIRVATWNIDSREENRSQRLDSIAGTLSEIDADVICLQECWEGAPQILADKLNMEVTNYRAEYGEVSSNAILYRLKEDGANAVEHITLNGLSVGRGTRNGMTSVRLISESGRKWRFASTHLAWGGMSEGIRRNQAYHLEALAASAEYHHGDLVQVLAGDFNALPDSATVRYLTGLDPDGASNSTLWVDSWATREPSSPGYTSVATHSLGSDVARRMGILDPSFVPARRIDYIFVRGFAHGRPGTPLSVKLLDRPFRGVLASDHYGLVANLWDPEIMKEEGEGIKPAM